jgi:hypothetical protein
MDKQPSRLGIVIRRLVVGIVLGLIAGLGLVSAKFLIEGIHPLDRWYAFGVCETMGAIAGTAVGLFWGLSALTERATRRPPREDAESKPR